MSEKPVIGFIGVGLMGRGMAANILRKGYPLVVMGHRNRAPVESLLAMGAQEAATPAELAQRCSILHLCVSGSAQVEEIVFGPDGILASGAKGLTVIDCSTSDPVSTKRVAAALAAAGIRFADAPLSRTPKEAEAGTLDTMVGASPEVFASIRPILACWAGIIVHLGPVGSGHTMKLVNNFIAMGYAALYSEALALARRSGLSPQQVDSVIGAGRLRNGFYDTFMKWTLEGDENAHPFTVANAHKDMRYVASLAAETGTATPMQAVLRNTFAMMDAAGQGDRFVPMLAGFVARLNGLPEREES